MDRSRAGELVALRRRLTPIAPRPSWRGSPLSALAGSAAEAKPHYIARMMTEPNDQTPNDEPPSSLPPKFVVSVKGFDDLEVARAMDYAMGEVAGELGRYIDLS